MFDFSGKYVLITGATGNLGQAVARRFSEHGATLILVDRAEGQLAQKFQDLPASQGHLLIDAIDVTQQADVERMAARAIEQFGRIDVLVNTVGGYRAGTPLHETDLKTWEFMLDLNARSVFLVSKAVIPHMLANRSGAIISVAARPGLKGSPRAAAYSVAKSAVLRLTESMSAELKSEGINVNCIIPGTIDTPQNREEMPDSDHSRWPSPESIANVIVFLASEAAGCIHGAAIPVYGLS